MELNREDGLTQDRRDYERALRASHQEAIATMAVALLTVLYFWGAVFLLEESDMTVFGLPLWFLASCIGGYFVSIAGVLFLVKRVFTDIPLDEAAEAYRRGEKR